MRTDKSSTAMILIMPPPKETERVSFWFPFARIPSGSQIAGSQHLLGAGFRALSCTGGRCVPRASSCNKSCAVSFQTSPQRRLATCEAHPCPESANRNDTICFGNMIQDPHLIYAMDQSLDIADHVQLA